MGAGARPGIGGFTVLTSVLAFLIVLGVLVFVHELGHFLAAKWAGIYVHRFSLGLGSPIPWLTFQRGETEYSISWLPLGGYVKMASQEEDIGASALEGGQVGVEVPPDRVFEAKPVWKRIIVILAGVTMNVLLAWAVFAFLAYKNGRQIDPETRVGRVVEEMVPAGGEALRQLEPGDQIVRVAGEPVHSWDQIQNLIANAPGDEVRIDLADGRFVVLPIHPDALEERLKASQAVQPFRAPVVGEVLEGRPAAGAGFQTGDTVIAVSGAPVRHWYDLLDLLDQSAGRQLAIVVGRAGGRDTLQVLPATDSVPTPEGGWRTVGRIGIAPHAEFREESYGLGEAVLAGAGATWGTTQQIVRTVRGLFSGRVSRRDVGGPILIGQLAGQSARAGLDVFLGFMALISVNLAILNMLPIPVLDGGQFLFLLAEAVIRRPLPAKLRERLTAVGLVLIVMLMGLAFSNDIRRLFGG